MAVSDNSYIVTGADMVSLADKIREKAGVSDGLVFPNGLIEAIEGLKTDGARVETGTVTFAEDTYPYTFVSDSPDIFIAHLDFLEPNQDSKIPVTRYIYKGSSDVNYVYAFIQYHKNWTYYKHEKTTIEWDIGFINGSKTIYAVAPVAPYKIGVYSAMNGLLGAGQTYRYWAIYGVTVE